MRSRETKRWRKRDREIENGKENIEKNEKERKRYNATQRYDTEKFSVKRDRHKGRDKTQKGR